MPQVTPLICEQLQFTYKLDQFQADHEPNKKIKCSRISYLFSDRLLHSHLLKRPVEAVEN